MSREANFFLMEPPDSSAARMPLGGRRRLAARRGRLEVLGALRVFSLARLREAFSFECSTLSRANLRLSSTE